MTARSRDELPPLPRALDGTAPRLVDADAAPATHSSPAALTAWEGPLRLGRRMATSVAPAAPPGTAASVPPAAALERRVLMPPPLPPRPPAPSGIAAAATPGQLLGGVEEVPVAVRREAEAATGAALEDVAVVRTAESARAAAAAGAMAFTRAGVVHMPGALGPLGAEPAREVLAHELVHVAQQRARGGRIPPEDSAEGRELERQAGEIATSSRAPRRGQPALPPGVASPPPPPAASEPMQRKPVDTASGDEPETQLDLDDLARRLYPRLRPYLRKELSLDRERAAANLRGLR